MVAAPDVLLVLAELVVAMINVADELTVVIMLVLSLIVVELQCVYVLFASASWSFCIVSRVYVLKDQG